MDDLVTILNKHGSESEKAEAAHFSCTSKRPRARPTAGKPTAFEKAEHFSQWMITEKLISTVPWDDAGAYVRFSVTFIAKDLADEKRVLAEIDRRLSGTTFEF